MRCVGLFSLGTNDGKRSFTGTSVAVADPTTNTIDLQGDPDVYFTGVLYNLAPETDVVMQLWTKGNASKVMYTVHARELIEFQNIPLEKIIVVLNGTVTMAGVGAFWKLDKSTMAGLGSEFNWLQNSYIKVSKIAANGITSGAASWQTAAKSTNPAAGTSLVSKTVGATAAYIYGIYINSPEANSFSLNWVNATVAKQKLYTISGAGGGTIIFTDPIPLNAGSTADAASAITIKNINVGVGDYQADVLVGQI